MTSAYDVLARIRATRSTPQQAGERCEMCSEPIADEHQHVVNVEGRQLLCVCRGCYLLFTDTEAQLRRRERMLTEAQSRAHMGSWEWDLATTAVRGSAELYRI